MEKSILSLLFLFSMSFCGDSTFINDSSYCIFPANERKFKFEFNNKTEYWTPTLQDIKGIEPVILNYLSKEGNQVYKKIGNYKRQYVGIIINKQRILYVNFFCGDEPHFRTKEIFVKDGGDCFFQIKINMINRKGIYLNINGNA
jgi:hypothetical protein